MSASYTGKHRRPFAQEEVPTVLHACALWDAFAGTMPAAGHAAEGRYRYSCTPALFSGRTEIARLELNGTIDLRITRSGWMKAKQDFAKDPAVRRDAARRDWIELLPQNMSDINRLTPLLAIATSANAASNS